MIEDIKTAAIAALKADAALAALLGGQHVYPGHVARTQQIPGCYVTGSDSSATLPGYASTKHRKNSPTLQVDVFHAGTSLQAGNVAKAVNAALLGAPLTGTYGWSSTTTEQFEEDGRLQHRLIRFRFGYSIQD